VADFAAVTSCLRAEVIFVSVDPLSLPESLRDPRSFLVRIDVLGGRLELVGRLDRRTVHLLQDAISTLLLTDRDVWVVDATDLTACDHAGVRAIGAAYRRAVRHDRRITLTGTPPSLREDLKRLRLDHHILERGDGLAADPLLGPMAVRPVESAGDPAGHPGCPVPPPGPLQDR
jgi:anti-anti-sigma regulatory factor